MGVPPPNTVLVVEDDHDTRVSIRTALEVEGYFVLSAANGAQALQLLEHTTPPGLILLDLMMPIMNGEMFLKCLAEIPRLREIPVLILSAYHEEARKLRQVFIRKPVDLQCLLWEVRQCLRTSEKSTSASPAPAYS